MTYNFIKNVILNESLTLKKLDLNKLPYDTDDLEPYISENTIDYHYGKLAKTYVTRFNNHEGDPDFNEAGAFLHNLLFPQYHKPTGNNTPHGVSEKFIEKHYKNFNSFKEEFKKVAMSIQGSGWAYLSKSGDIKTIKNHQIKNDIILLIDWWEHAWVLDYQHDKERYLKNQWKIINWDIINTRIGPQF